MGPDDLIFRKFKKELKLLKNLIKLNWINLKTLCIYLYWGFLFS